MMKRRKKRGKTAGVKKAKRIVRKKRAAKRTGAVVSMPEAVQAPAAPPVEKIPYVAPKRAHINDAVCALLPHIDPKLIKKLDYWALYTIHQDVVKSGKDAETLARSLIKGYDPAKAFPVSPAQSAAAVTAKEQERMMRAKEIENRKVDAKKRELAARERARVAKELARAKAQAAKDRERAARAARSLSLAACALARASSFATRARSRAASSLFFASTFLFSISFARIIRSCSFAVTAAADCAGDTGKAFAGSYPLIRLRASVSASLPLLTTSWCIV